MYGKVFRSMWDGTLGPRWEVWSVFVFLVAHANADGVVEMTPEAIAARSGIPLEAVEKAVAALCAPDSRSRSREEEGRRLVPVDEKGWGWQIVNYLSYRNLRDEDERRRQNREAQARRRSKHPSAAVSQRQPPSAQEEGEEEAVESNTLVTDVTEAGEERLSEWLGGFPAFWEQYPRKVARRAAEKAYMKLKPRTQATYDLLFAGLRVWLKEWEGRDMDKVPHASTWLNQGRYADAER